MSAPRRTCLHAFHARHGARFVDFAGWEMPVQYKSILEEHKAVRSAAGLFDVSHMGELRVVGSGAAAFLNRVVTNDVSRLKTGRALYTPMCTEDGGVVDDLIVYCLGPEEFLLCLNASNTAKDIAWIRDRASVEGFRGELLDESDSTGLLALQGPKAADILQKLVTESLSGMRAFDVRRAEVGSTRVPAMLARTGYTGEDGFEIFLPSGQAETIADQLLQAGVSEGLVLSGLGARDSLRTEAGYPLYAHELDAEITPVQAGIGWTVKLAKAGGFLGDAALRRETTDGTRRKVVWFRTGDRRIVRPGAAVFSETGQVGRVLSGTLSPGLNESIGSAHVDTTALNGRIWVDLRGMQLELKLATPPLAPMRVG